MILRARFFILSVLMVSLLAACAGQPVAEDSAGVSAASEDDGPTIYGRVNVSVDHATVR